MKAPKYLPPAETVARAFCSELLRAIGPIDLSEAAKLNAADEDKNCCHTHDYCDSNVCMDEAFKRTSGFSSMDFEGDKIISGGCMSEAAMNVWNQAWTMAKAANFSMPKLPYRVTVHIDGYRKFKLHVPSVDSAMAAIKSYLPSRVLNVPVVKTTSGRVAAILKAK